MKSIKRTLTSVPLMLIAACACAQLSQYQPNNVNTFNEGNPDTYSATRSTIYKVNESTGIPGISIPFFNITQNGYTLPVSINYNASGIKVDESASRIGLGWTLNAGGVVSRAVKGIPDYNLGAAGSGYGTYGASNPLPMANQTLTIPSIQAVLGKIFTGQIDGEPDLTMYSFGNRGGKFFVNPTDNKAYTVPFQNILIENGAFGGYADCYKITDEDGIQYFFADIEQVTIKDKFGTILSDAKTTSYHLTKIVLTDNSVITFQYNNTLTYTTFAGNRDTKLDRIMGDQRSGDPCDAMATAGQGASSIQRTSIFLHIITPRLQTIIYDQGRLEFTYAATSRTDITGDFRLMQIAQYDKADHEVKKYILEHDYTPTYGGAVPTNGRLRLKTVTEQDKNGKQLLPVTFSYNNIAFPPVGTTKQDLWGYYNNENNDAGYDLYGGAVTSLMPEQQNGAYTYITQGALRNINPTYTQAAVLTGIGYPDGASVAFTFENNVYRDVYTGLDETGPGLRVKMIAADDGLGNIKYTSYKYLTDGSYPSSSGKLNDIKFSSSIKFTMRLNLGKICPCLLRKADPLNKTPFLSGSPIYYTRVEVIEHAGVNIAASKIGSTVYLYDFHNDYNSATGLFLIKDHLNALLRRVTVFNQDGDSVAYTQYDYATPVNKSTLIGTMPFLQTIDTLQNNSYGYNTYQIFSSWMPVSSITSKVYEIGSTLRGKDESTVFSYNTSLLVESKITSTGGNVYKTKYKYPGDYVVTTVTDEQSQAIRYMLSRHIYTPVIESITLKNGLVTGGELSHFKVLDAGVFPKRAYALKNMNPYTEGSHVLSVINGSGNFTYSSNYKLQSEVGVYAPSGAPIEVDNRNSKQSMILNPVVGQVVATCSKAVQNDIAYCSFEEYEIAGTPSEPTLHLSSNWTLTGNCFTSLRGAEAFAGTGSIALGGTCHIGLVTARPLTPAITYRLTFWAKNGNPNVSITGGPSPSYSTLQTTNDWKLYQYLITGATAITISKDGSCLIDELKLSPEDGDFSNTVYKPLVGIASQSDNNNNYTHYVYDNFGRLVKVLDHNLNIIKAMEYVQREAQ
ncbi:MAG: hypothetical protein P0Y49_18975 [Candidatus Pedobacter colombiensis]|uniref:YD repeat-containing protein n=1 Tax=Candidatus Pedobacter colombiensis TaxID=3121371 RepID=A0AAJ5W6E9_9SPHI|nr:hypothetical protein [Pedobacter sp.]WEK18862.1 MAG: hypothetical protein P0Y49_18975 [Pedobacter sp.]